MKRIHVLPVLAACALAVGLLGPSASARPTADADIVQTATAAGQFTTLASLLTKAGLVDTLSTGGTFTVFAPTDAAFAKVPKATLDALAADPAKLKSVLLYHVVAGKVGSADVVKLTSAKTLEGQPLAIKVADGSVYIDSAKVITPDVMAANGVIHVIDSVLIPTAAPTKNILQTAKAAGQFKTLNSLIARAGLVGALKADGPFTVFAPTDAAFAKVPKKTLDALAADKAKLRAVLLYHVVKGNVTAAKVVELKSAKTLNGKRAPIEVMGSKVMIGGATVTTADIPASNGVIHIVNKVLIP
jgi:uncharacterized surface protein with fasciclin (FAS1) repeats